jgi:hypothetical protein
MSSNTKRSESEIRKEMLDKGALLLHFSTVNPSYSAEEWRHIEKHGFLVTTGGCLIPYRPFSNRAKDGKKSICRACRAFFYGDTISKDQRRSTFNELGWPNSLQYSHLCHDGDCGSPLCVTIEEQYKNLKRNFCGEFGSCDCGNKVQCTSVYKPSNVTRRYNLITYDTPDCSKKLKELFPNYGVRVLPKDHFRVEDLKKENRSKRNKREKKHNAKKRENLGKSTLDSYLKRNPDHVPEQKKKRK